MFDLSTTRLFLIKNNRIKTLLGLKLQNQVAYSSARETLNLCVMHGDLSANPYGADKKRWVLDHHKRGFNDSRGSQTQTGIWQSNIGRTVEPPWKRFPKCSENHSFPSTNQLCIGQLMQCNWAHCCWTLTYYPCVTHFWMIMFVDWHHHYCW